MEDAYVAKLVADLKAQGVEGEELVQVVAEVLGIGEDAARAIIATTRFVDA